MGKQKKYYWLKLKTDFFNQREIKKLRNIAGGDTYTIIYLKMQLLSIKNEGLIEFKGTEENIYEQLSLELDEEIDNVKITLSYLFNNNLVEMLDKKTYLLTKVPETIGSEVDSAERVRQFRERKRQEELQCNAQLLLSNTNVTKSNTEIDKELEKERELEKRRNYYVEIVDYLNDALGTKYRSTAKKTRSLINARLADGFTVDDFKTAIDNMVLVWANDKRWKPYLRPDTLFTGKMDSYLNRDVSDETPF